MRYNSKKHNRKSIRLKGYDYSQEGFYFITICTQNHECLFGKITSSQLDEGTMVLNDAGKMVETQWLKLSNRFKNIELYEYVVMPNHFHGILQIVGAGLVPAQKNKTVGDMVGVFQSIATVEYIHGVKNNNWQPFDKRLWHRNYWEHIIRNEKEYENIAQYIINNPKRWAIDKLNNNTKNTVSENMPKYNDKDWMS